MRGRAAILWLSLAAGAAGADPVAMVFPRAPGTETISVAVSPSLRSMTGLPWELQNARRQMHRGEELSDALLRRLAAANDGLAAHRYVRRLLDRPGADPSDVAFYSAIAVGTGRVWTLPDMVRAMERLDPATEPRERVRKYIQVLYGHAWAGNTLALDAVVAFNGQGRLFGPLSDTTRQRLLVQAAAIGDGRLELVMGARLLDGGAARADDRAAAAEYLDRAAASEHPGIAAAALALLRTAGLSRDRGGG